MPFLPTDFGALNAFSNINFLFRLHTHVLPRELYISTTFKNNAKFLQTVYNMWNASIPLIANATDVIYSLTLQPIPPAITKRTAPLGGDSLGLDPSDGPLVLCQVSISWSLASDDSRIYSTERKFFDEIDEASKAAGLFNRFKYLNYAAPWQKPIDGYGPKNKAYLQAVSRKYDPKGMFQKGVPGGYKLFTTLSHHRLFSIP